MLQWVGHAKSVTEKNNRRVGEGGIIYRIIIKMPFVKQQLLYRLLIISPFWRENGETLFYRLYQHRQHVHVHVYVQYYCLIFFNRPFATLIDVFRASGNGGQSVNTTDSAVRATHIPTGISVASQQEKSQHKNKDIALRILRARIYEIQKAEEDAKHAETKRSQVGTGDRSEKIRTYNFHQNRVTDHRFGITIHNLPEILDGALDDLIDQIILTDCERKLQAL